MKQARGVYIQTAITCQQITNH